MRLPLEAAAPRTIARVVLVGDGKELRSVPGEGRREMELDVTVTPGTGFHWCYRRAELVGPAPKYAGNVKVAEGHLAWSSPHRVEIQ